MKRFFPKRFKKKVTEKFLIRHLKNAANPVFIEILQNWNL